MFGSFVCWFFGFFLCFGFLVFGVWDHVDTTTVSNESKSDIAKRLDKTGIYSGFNFWVVLGGAVTAHIYIYIYIHTYVYIYNLVYIYICPDIV